MLYKRNKIYHTSYYHNGKRYRQSLHTTDEKAAKSREMEIISYMTNNAIKSGEITLWCNFKAWYLRYLSANKSVGTQYIQRRAIMLLETYRTPYYLRHITPDFLSGFTAFLTEEYKGKHAACRNRYLLAIKIMMRTAEQQGKIGIKQDWRSISRDRMEKDNRVEFHSKEELEQIKQALQNKGDLLTVFYLGWACGLRRGEIAYLHKKDYDPIAHTLSITAKENWRPKTQKSARTIPLTAHVEEIIKKSIKRTPNSCYLINVSGCRENGNYLSVQYIRALKVELPYLHCFLHKLRHTFGSLLVEKETPLKVVSDLMGHRNILQTEKYVHIGDKQQIKAVELLPEI